MRALDREVMDAVWAAGEQLLPTPSTRAHPLGCHRRRVPNRVCFDAIVIRLVTGCSWETVEQLIGYRVSDTTLRTRRDEWIRAGVFDNLITEALAAYDRIIGLDLRDVAVDGSIQKAPCGGDGTGSNPVDRGKLGWKWSICTDRNGITLGWTTAGANRQDNTLLPATLAAVEQRGLLVDIETLHLDRGYDNRIVRADCQQLGLTDVIIARKRKRRPGRNRTRVQLSLAMRWPVERTNSWFVNYGQLRRNTDRQPSHRDLELALAATIIITIKLIDWRNRWSPIR